MKDRTNISGFFIFLILFLMIVLLAGFLFNLFRPRIESPEKTFQRKIEKLSIEVPSTDGWREYVNDWYGFQLKYPESFKAPKVETGNPKGLWEKKYVFSRNQDDGNLFSGFEVIVYDVDKVKEITATDEFPKKRSSMKQEGFGICENSEDYLQEVDGFPAEEVFVSQDNYCYFGAFFFTLVREEYIINILPLAKDGDLTMSQNKGRVIREFPEFLGVVSSLDLRDISRPVVVPRPVISAPMPVSYKVVDGRLVCAKKNDHPRRSKQNKKKHLDLECCLDPDEYPNPHCYYDPKKYGKYL